jgi:trimeric autotransporter adhesin
MTRSKWVLCLALAGVIGACGGRNGLRSGAGDGGTDNGDARRDGLTSDGKQDVPDGLRDVVATDARLDVSSDARLDVADAPQTDSRPDVPTDNRTPDVNSDVRDGNRDVPFITDGPRDVPDGRQDASDGGPAVTLSSIEIAPATVTVNLGTPTVVKITAVYSDSSNKDVSVLTSLTSGDTSVVTASGVTLTGVKAGATSITASYQGKTATANVTVVDNNPLKTVTIDPIPNLAIGGTANLVATGVFANGSKQDVTALASWTSANPAIVTVGDSSTTKGQVKGIASGGPVVITALVKTAAGAVSGTVSITVDPKKLKSIQITPTNPTMAQGETQAFTATGTYDDSSTGSVTQQATWSSDTATVVTIVASGANAGSARAVGQGSATITAAIGDIKATSTVTVSGARLARIVVSGQATIIVGSTQAYTAEGQYADGTTKDITTSVAWSSTNTANLSISNAAGTQGQATGMAAGTSNVRATLNNVTGQLAVTVSDKPLRSISVTPNPMDNLVVGLMRPMTANATYGDAPNTIILDVTSTATWTIDDSSVATVGTSSATAGQVTGWKAGTAKVTATLSGISGSAVVNVTDATLTSITIVPSTASVRAGRSVSFKATGNFSNSTALDITNDATWTSSDTTVAQVSDAAGSKGQATGVAASSTAVTITATYKTVKGTASLTVTEPHIVSIRITPASVSLDVGATAALTVTGVYENGTTTTNLTGVNWSSSNEAVATVTANGGRPPFGGGGATVTAKTKGTTVITASYTPTGETTALTDTSAITVTEVATPVKIRLTPATATIQVDGTQMFTVFLDYSDGTTQQLVAGVTLTSSNGSVASVPGGGRGGGPGGLLVTGVGPGTATITANYATGNMTDTAQITVSEKTVKGLYITPPTASVKVGGTQQFQAFVTYDDGTSAQITGSASWTTSDGSLATISNAGGGGGRGAIPGAGGLATGSAAGEVKIQASYAGQTATAVLTITAPKPTSLVITPSTGTIYLDGTMSFVANLIYDDNTSANVTATSMWSSDNASVVVLSTAGGGRGGGPGPGGGLQGGGTATGVGVGKATITAVYTTDTGVELKGTAAVTVTDPPIKELQLSPTNPTVTLANPNVQFTATVIYTDYSTRNVTAAATWSSSNSAVALVNGGRATGVSKGTATITATYGGAKATMDVTVTDKKVTSLQVTPTNPTTHLGVNKSFVAVAVYDDSTNATVTGQATWTSSAPTVATVGTTGGTGGVATPLSAGKATITATYQGVSGSSDLTVSSAALQSITITPPGPLHPAVGATQQLTATGSYSDGTENLTSLVTWTWDPDGYATVSNAAGTRGLLTGVKEGTTTVSAHFQGVAGTITVNVGGSAVTPDAGTSD